MSQSPPRSELKNLITSMGRQCTANEGWGDNEGWGEYEGWGTDAKYGAIVGSGPARHCPTHSNIPTRSSHATRKRMARIARASALAGAGSGARVKLAAPHALQPQTVFFTQTNFTEYRTLRSYRRGWVAFLHEHE